MADAEMPASVVVSDGRCSFYNAAGSCLAEMAPMIGCETVCPNRPLLHLSTPRR